MLSEALSILVLFAFTTFVVVASVEIGYKLGKVATRRKKVEKESPVSTIEASILGLLAFMLAFTFGIVTDRFEARKVLVRDEANAISSAYMRSEFLPETEREGTAKLYAEYVDLRLNAIQLSDTDKMSESLDRSAQIQRQLWNAAVVNARNDPHSTVAALYVDALNKMGDIEALRIAVGLHSRIPFAIWLVLYALVIFGMIGVGYQTVVDNSERSWSVPLLALSFAVVIALIAALDRPKTYFVPVSQQPMESLRATMTKDADAHSHRNPTLSRNDLIPLR